MKFFPVLALAFGISFSLHAQPPLEWRGNGYIFSWNVAADHAECRTTAGTTIWSGSLLPAFVVDSAGHQKYISPKPDAAHIVAGGDSVRIPLRYAGLGTGELIAAAEPGAVRIRSFRLHRSGAAAGIVAMYAGTDGERKFNVPAPGGYPFANDWNAAGFCIPGAKEGPVQSYFRNWDFGASNISLGSFGPSMGAPYGAAFPRPALFAGLGSDSGWVTIGAGALPDAPLTAKLRSAKMAFEWLYREDLWPNASPDRVWNDLLRITVGKTAPESFRAFFATFGPRDRKDLPGLSIWNSWGNWRKKDYAMNAQAVFAAKLRASVIVFDDGWESFGGSGVWNETRFPSYRKMLDSLRQAGVETGYWESLAWIDDTTAAGLTSADLLLDAAGRPVMTNWNFDAASPGSYCLDPASAKARGYLVSRTERMMRELHPRVIKLDFGYALPSPDMSVSRDPAYRGERMAYSLAKIIADAAHAADSAVRIMYYGIHPVWASVADVISLDDQGDLWYDVRQGHYEWSLWASLLSQTGVQLSASSSYDWTKDETPLLNTAWLGMPGSTLPTVPDEGGRVADEYSNRRLAINTWFRRTARFETTLETATTGGLGAPPAPGSLVRWETFGGRRAATVLVLREKEKSAPVHSVRFTGDWAIIAQDDADVLASKQLAVIPFRAGTISIPRPAAPRKVLVKNLSGTAPFAGWRFADGRLTLSVDAKTLARTAGFLIE